MKWNEFPNTKPEKEGLYVVRFTEKVRGYRYGFRSFNICPDGQTKFSKGVDDAPITHWAHYADFQESSVMLKRPTNFELVKKFLDVRSGEELGKLFAELFSDDEMKEILIEKMSNATAQGIADDEWDDYCFERDCEREDELFRMGHYA